MGGDQGGFHRNHVVGALIHVQEVIQATFLRSVLAEATSINRILIIYELLQPIRNIMLTLPYYLKQFDVFFEAEGTMLSLEIAESVSMAGKNV